MDFLAEILERKRVRLAEAKTRNSLDEVCARALDVVQQRPAHAFREALNDSSRVNVIAEFKRRSPSKGEILAGADPVKIAQSYSAGGAAAISVLTEEHYFDGSLEDLRKIKSAVNLPVLRKDFVFDPYQIYEAAAHGADGVLLIVAALDDDALLKLRELAEDELGLDALVEVHTSTEMDRANKSGARLIGVNNRNLSTFKVRLETSFDLAAMANPNAILVSESGLSNAADVKRLRNTGYSAFLIGETLMRSSGPANTLKSFMELAGV
jgi:indole-3-glycerol phosphate synthase